MAAFDNRHVVTLLGLACLALDSSGCARNPGQAPVTQAAGGSGNPPHVASVVNPPANAPTVSAPTAPARAIAMQRSETQSTGQLQVSSPDIQSQAAIPPRHTAYGDNISPALSWTPVAGAQSYALLLEDPDAPTPQPFLHWIAWNIPASVHALPEHLPLQQALTDPGGMQQGQNGSNAIGYSGPRPPAGDPPHHYHFEVFALDRMLKLSPDTDRDALLGAIASHVIGRGELVATSAKP